MASSLSVCNGNFFLSATAAPGNPLFHEAEPGKGNLPRYGAVFKKQVSDLVEFSGCLDDVGPQRNMCPCSFSDAQTLETLPGRGFEVGGEARVKLDEVIHGIFLLAALKANTAPDME
jgi:hypothetical protein